MATLAELNVVIGAQIDDFEARMAEVEQGIGRVGKYAKDAGAALTQYITLPLALVAGAALKTASDLQALEKGFEATYKGSEPLQDALAKVRELAKLPGLGLQEALQGATNLQAAGFSADVARRALGAFGNALATVGKGKADLEGVTTALSQIASKGKISAEEINQLAERVPQIRKAMQAAFGTADTEALQKAGIGATEFVEKVTAELEKLPKVTGGLKNAFENLSDAGTIALGKLGTALNKSFDIEGIVGKLSDFLGGLADKFESLDPAVQKTIFVLGGIAAAAGPVLLALGAIGTAIPAVVAGFTLIGGPVLAIVAGVAAAAILIIRNWDTIKAYFTTGGGSDIFGAAADVAQQALLFLRSLVDDAVSRIKLIWQTFGPAILDAASTAFEQLKILVGGALNIISDLFRLFGAALRGDWAAVWEGVKQLAIDGLNLTLKVLTNTVAGSLSLLGKLASAVGASGVGDAFGRAAAYVREFGASLLLKSPADAARKATKEVAAAAAELTVSNAAAAKTTPINPAAAKQAEDMGKALEKLRESLRVVDGLSVALGQNYEFIGERQKVLESGVKSLIDAGFSPASAAVRQYSAELIRLDNILAGAKLKPVDISLPTSVNSPNAGLQEGLKQIGDYRAQLQDLQRQTAFLPLPSFVEGGSGVSLSEIVSKTIAQQQELQTAYAGVTAVQKTAADQFAINNTAIAEDFQNLGLNLLGSLSGVGEAIGAVLADAAAGTATGADILATALSAAVDVLATYAREFGRKLVLLGAGNVALGNVGQGLAQIAAGVALTAGAAIASSLAKPSGNRTPGIAPTAMGKPSVAAAAQSPQKLQISVKFEPVEMRQDGPSLRGVLNVSEYNIKRFG